MSEEAGDRIRQANRAAENSPNPLLSMLREADSRARKHDIDGACINLTGSRLGVAAVLLGYADLIPGWTLVPTKANEDMALAIELLQDPSGPLAALQYQEQLDDDGIMVGVSRQALDEVRKSVQIILSNLQRAPAIEVSDA